MHKLIRPNKPDYLTDEKKEELIKKFKGNGDNVWNKKPIKEPLMEMSNNKCAYCECKVDEESKYVEVEHFAHKAQYEDKVVDWDNLLPSCKRCNTKKGKHDVRIEPIVDPSKVDPREHLRFKNYRFRGKTDIGECTEEVLDLNDLDRLMEARFNVGEKVYQKLSDLKQHVKQYLLQKEEGKINHKILNKITTPFKKLMEEGMPQSAYCSTVSTVLLDCSDYAFIKDLLEKEDIWDDSYQKIENGLKAIAYLNPKN